MRGRTRVGGAAVAALLATVGLAACGDGDDTGPAPTTWSAADATNTSDKGGEKVEGGDYKVVPGSRWNVSLPDGGKSAMVDPTTWPDVQKVLSSDQLKGIMPTMNLTQPTICARGRYNISGGGETPHNAQCSWELKGRTILDNGGRLRLTLRGIGADSEVVSMWDDVRTKYRKDASNDDAFYRDGTYGARRVLLLRRGLGSFVVSDGEVAAWFDVKFPDTGFLVDDNAPETFKTVRTKVYPTMIETFVTFLPREH